MIGLLRLLIYIDVVMRTRIVFFKRSDIPMDFLRDLLAQVVLWKSLLESVFFHKKEKAVVSECVLIIGKHNGPARFE